MMGTISLSKADANKMHQVFAASLVKDVFSGS